MKRREERKSLSFKIIWVLCVQRLSDSLQTCIQLYICNANVYIFCHQVHEKYFSTWTTEISIYVIARHCTQYKRLTLLLIHGYQNIYTPNCMYQPSQIKFFVFVFFFLLFFRRKGKRRRRSQIHSRNANCMWINIYINMCHYITKPTYICCCWIFAVYRNPLTHCVQIYKIYSKICIASLITNKFVFDTLNIGW